MSRYVKIKHNEFRATGLFGTGKYLGNENPEQIDPFGGVSIPLNNFKYPEPEGSPLIAPYDTSSGVKPRRMVFSVTTRGSMNC